MNERNSMNDGTGYEIGWAVGTKVRRVSLSHVSFYSSQRFESSSQWEAISPLSQVSRSHLQFVSRRPYLEPS
jgi:hypothetical protein